MIKFIPIQISNNICFLNSIRIENIYNEQVKDSISNLFLGKNSCILQFGPSNSGKTYCSINPDPIDQGLIIRSINDIFNFIEISKSSNKNQLSKNISNLFNIKISIYQIYNDSLNDLLSNQYSKNLNVNKINDDEDKENNKILIPDLTSRELKFKKDFDLFLIEADNNRKNLSQALKVNEMNKKSHIVISLMIGKREKYPDRNNKMIEQVIENFAQIDFVELADSNFGLSTQSEDGEDEDNKIEPVDDLLYRFISKTYNTISNNILAVANGTNVKNDSKLTLSLKNTLKINSQIIMITNAIPYQDPPFLSVKALKVKILIVNILV